ncbi:MAG TPA: hypothetical protein VF636_02105, partial [Sphingomonas sp.]
MSDAFSGMVRRIYETVAEPHRHEQVMAEVLEATGSRYMLMAATGQGVETREPSFFGDFTGLMLDGIRNYREEMHGIDPTFEFVAANPTAGFFATDRHMTREEHATHPFVAWTRHHFGNQHWSLRYMLRDGLHFGVALHPLDRSDPHRPEERELFDLLLEHMACAWRIATRPPDLSTRSDACVVLNATGQVAAISPAGEAVMAAGDGLRIQERRLSASDGWAERRLGALVGAALSPFDRGQAGGSMCVPRPSGKRPFYVNIDPLPEQAGFGRLGRGAIVRIIDPDAGSRPLGDRLVE